MVKVRFSFFYFLVSRIIFLGIFCISTDSLAQISSFKIEANNNSGKIDHDIICDIYGDSLIIGVIPNQVRNVNLISTFSISSNNKVFIGSDQQISGNTINDFSTPLYYSVYNGDKLIKRYKVEIINTGLPVIYINTENQAPVVSRDIYVNGKIWVYPNDQSAVFSAPMEIKGRGNATWGLPKSPYKIKLLSKASILGMPSDKEWVLLANFYDKSLIRNILAFDMSSKMNLAYTPKMFAVDFVFNGSYKGTYLFGEQIKIAKNRVNIKELEEDDNSESVVSGGYLFEINQRLDEITWLKTKHNVPITFKSPGEATPQQYQYIKSYLQEMEDVLYSDTFNTENGYKKYLNPDSFIDYYWVNEVFKNNDAQYWSSIFLFKDRGDRVNMGPVWDFDLALGNIDFSECTYPSGWWIRDSLWMKRLFEDPAFKASAYNRWNELKKDVIPFLINQVSYRSNEISKSQRLNFYKWPILGQYVWPNAIITNSYAKEVDYLLKWLEARVQWIDEQINPVSTPASKFTLISPENKENIIISNISTEDVLNFTWENAATASVYEILLDTVGGDFNDPLLEIRSESFGFDTTVSLSGSTVAQIFEQLDVKDGQSVNLVWQVKAYNSSDLLSSEQRFNLNLKNGTLIDFSTKINNIKVYPNPTAGLLTIETEKNLDIEQVTLYNLMGQKIEEFNFQNGWSTINFDISVYPKGTYVIHLISRFGERFIQRVVVN